MQCLYFYFFSCIPNSNLATCREGPARSSMRFRVRDWFHALAASAHLDEYLNLPEPMNHVAKLQVTTTLCTN